MCHSNCVKKVLACLALIIGIFFISHGLTGLQPVFVITITKSWPAYLAYSQQLHPDILTNSILLILSEAFDILDLIHHIVTGIILIISFKTPRYRKAIIVCGLIAVFFFIGTMFYNAIVDFDVTFRAILGRTLLSLFVIFYGLYLQHTANKERMG